MRAAAKAALLMRGVMLGVVLGVMLSLMLAACTDSRSREIRLLSGAEPAELARNHLAGAVLEQQGFTVIIEAAPLGQIWQRLWAGKADASLSVWLPEASAPFVERFFDRLHDLGPRDGMLASEAGRWPAGDRPHTLVRRSLEQEAPEAFSILAALRWQAEDLERIMSHWQQDGDWPRAARAWLEARPVEPTPEPQP
ncbi:ABC-type proline/glycine betaine transport system substrate-binding protein [Oceanisphaera litoralis]|uniref:glycine betaine ABC transporter substrate-binding protein n=1 Tax=Oceanisphaera litoralis TaxID=225144 RepID=UPI00195769FD|nr:glycine betaine ABC transporter substrate-binding protein [Oceanisphaera litoralis]MBM7455282.1 ABC-type proline/glycine betaine transport system substrate-binding protein [Oceanisphaera litoralis]